MYGSVISALLLGIVPMWGALTRPTPVLPLNVAPPAHPSTAMTASLSGPSSALGSLSASGVIVVDVESGQRLYSRNAAIPRPMASLTKQMTALLIVEKYGDALDTWVTVPQSVRSVEGSVAPLVPGGEYQIGDLLSALLVASANDAAVALATIHSGSPETFVELMNKRARELGLRDTSFDNPAGLDALHQRSTPQDIAWLAMYAVRYPQIRDRMSLRTVSIATRDGHALALSHTHALLHSEPDILAGKTGTTDGAGQCLLSLVEESGRTYLVVLLGSHDRYRDMRVILDALRV